MWKRLGFDRHESRVLVWGGATLFLAGWADVSLQNVSEAYFMNEVGPHRLPYVFLASSALMVATTWFFGYLAARSQRLRLLPRVLAALGLALLPFWWLITTSDDPANASSQGLKSVFGLLVIASKQVQSVALLVFWAAMNDLVNPRQAKRVFAPLTAGWTLGTILGSFASKPLADWLGVPFLVPLSTLALLLAAATTYPLRRGLRSTLERGGLRRMLAAVRSLPDDEVREQQTPASVRALWRESRLFRLLLVTVLLSGMLAPMLYFQFQWVVGQATTGIAGSTDRLKDLIALYSVFRGWVNLGVLVAQLAFVSSLYRWIGIPLSVAMAPFVYMLGFAGLSVRLALPVGIGAMAATRLQDNAVFEPAFRVLYNLFPDQHRSRAGSFLEGPVKRGAGALGNLVVIAALQGATQAWVGYSGMGLAVIWLGAALVLWREYPRLLLAAGARRRALASDDLSSEMLDSATVRILAAHLLDPEPERCAAALALVEEARPELAIPTLASALRQVPVRTRPLLLSALEEALDQAVTAPVRDATAAEDVERLLEDTPDLTPLDRSRLVQCYGRLAPRGSGSSLLGRATGDAVPAVRLAAAAALGSDDLDARLRAGVQSGDPGERTIARREIRAALLCDPDAAGWDQRIDLLVGMLDVEAERRDAAFALADVAERQGDRAGRVAEAVLRFRDDADRQTRAALLRFAGHAGCEDQTGWLVDHLTSSDELAASAARQGLVALGSRVTDVLLKEASHGRRSKRDAILPLLRDLHVDHDDLWDLYEKELEGIRRLIVLHHVLVGTPGLELVVQRLDERADEGFHTALLLLAGLRDRYTQEFEDLAESLPGTPSGRRRATLVEVLEVIADAREKADLLPLLDEDADRRCQHSARELGIEVPGDDEALRQLQKSSDELTRTLVAGCLRTLGRSDLAPPEDLEDHPGVLSPTEIALQLKGLPMFDGLTTRQLMDLARVVTEVKHPPEILVVEEEGLNESMFLIVEGQVEVRKQGRRIANLGPNEFFGEMSVLERARPSASVVTTLPTRLLCLQRGDLFRLMEEFPTIPIIMCQTLSRRMRELLEDRTRSA